MPRLSLLTYSVSGALLAYGLIHFTFGPCLTAMAETYQVPLGSLGLIFSMFSLGLIPSVLAAGLLSELLGRRTIFLFALGMVAVSCALFAAAPSLGSRPTFAWGLAAAGVLGLSSGGMETLVNAIVADDNRPSPGFALNLTHAFFAGGAVLGPLAASLLLRAQLPWQYAFYWPAGVVALALLALAPQPIPANHTARFTPAAAWELLRAPMLWVFLSVIALYVGAEVGINAWVSPLMERVLGAPRGDAGLAVSVFWVLMIVGRLASSSAAARWRPAPLVLALAVGSCVSSLAVALSPSATVCLVAMGAAGLFMSGIFGLVVTHAAHRFHERIGAVYGVMLTGVGVGPLLFPALMGGLAEAAGLRVAMLVPAALMSGVALIYLRYQRE